MVRFSLATYGDSSYSWVSSSIAVLFIPSILETYMFEVGICLDLGVSWEKPRNLTVAGSGFIVAGFKVWFTNLQIAIDIYSMVKGLAWLETEWVAQLA